MEPTTQEMQRPALREWHRRHAERRIAGVCAGLAHELGVPLTLVRTVFVVVTVLPGMNAIGPIFYLALWMLMPPAPGAPSAFDRAVGAGAELLGVGDPPRRRGMRGGERL
jgi:phage shock protein PspC (stress-responsive transcriptional regulator)